MMLAAEDVVPPEGGPRPAAPDTFNIMEDRGIAPPAAC